MNYFNNKLIIPLSELYIFYFNIINFVLYWSPSKKPPGLRKKLINKDVFKAEQQNSINVIH